MIRRETVDKNGLADIIPRDQRKQIEATISMAAFSTLAIALLLLSFRHWIFSAMLGGPLYIHYRLFNLINPTGEP